MPAFGNIVIDDGATTPVVHTFAPVAIDAKGVASWADRSSGVPASYLKLDASNTDPSGSGTQNREVFTVRIPVVADGSDPNVKAGTLLRTFTAQLTVAIPVSSTLQERKDLYAYSKNFLATSTVQSMIQDLEHVY